MTTTNATLLRDRPEPGIALLRLHRPDKRNALDSATLTALTAALADLAGDADLRALVLSTSDPKAFCAGADVGEVLDHAGGVARMTAFTELYTSLDEFPVPTIAVCVGNCVGAGAEIVAGCDLRVVGDNLHLAWAGARLGVPVGPARLAPLVGTSRAKELVLTGRVVDATEAMAIGLAHRRAAAAEAESVALDLARTVVGQSGDGVRVLKQMFRDLDGSPARVAYENQRLLDFQRTGSGLPTGGISRDRR